MAARDSRFWLAWRLGRFGWLAGLVVGLGAGIGIGWWLGEERRGGVRPGAAPGGMGPGAEAHQPLAVLAGERVAGAGWGNEVVIPLTGDLEAVFAAVLEIDDSAARRRAVARVLARLPTGQWPVWLAAMNRFKERQAVDDDPALQARVLTGVEEVLAAMAARDPVGGLRVVREAGGEVESLAFESLLRYWAEDDLPAALAYHEAALRGGAGSPGTEALARVYVQKDPAAAFAWAESLPQQERAEASLSALWTLSRRDPEAARFYLTRLSGLDPDGERGLFAHHIAENWARTEPAAAYEWAVGLPTELAGPAFAGVVEPWFSRDWQAAWEVVGTMDGQAREIGLKAAVDEMSKARAPEVMERLMAEAPGEAVAEAIAQGARKFHGWAPEQAESWLGSLPPGPHRDAAIQGVIDGGIGRADPEAAAAWAGAVEDPQRRAVLLTEQLGQWFLASPSAARQWVQTTDRLRAEDRAVWVGWLEQVGR